ncbi:hypothetical protein [Terasakiella sp. SH-1]|uniref:hypothetical protein n=1 Tax=Terasakiella sp. SH-1 TaxID=2560057 RepID=UPI001431AD03|nr:hypothetical protein [Terasakiella sp. SH-1]
MSDSQKNINDLAAQYMELWQKQLASPATERAMGDAMKTAEAFGEQSAELMKNLDSPEKVQNWMQTWTESWKAQFEDGKDPLSQFAAAATQGAKATGAPSGDAVDKLDELSQRIDGLEHRIRELESKLTK